MSYSNKKWYKPEKLCTKIIFATILLVLIRLLSNIPVPMINRTYLSTLFQDSSAFSLLNTFSGGSFTNMTIMALGVTPYISATIILQLLCVTFPRIKDLQKDYTAEGKKKWKLITVITGIILAIIQAIGLSISLGKRGLFNTYNAKSVIIVSLIWVIGATITILISEYITKYCIGNGTSLILAGNIIAELPGDIISFWTAYINDKPVKDIIVAAIIFAIIVIVLISFTIVLTNAQKEIPVVYPRSSKSAYSSKSSIPIKLNTAGVMPIIFTSTIFSIPLMFISYSTTNKIALAIYKMCSSAYRYSTNIYGIIGLVLDLILVVLFAYFYTAMQFNTTEIANRLRKQGACIPGIRPGQPTDDYLYSKVKNMTFIGAILLFILTQIPTIITSTTSIYSLSFGGTSVIIVVGVILETTVAIRSELLVKNYNKHVNKSFIGLTSDYSRY